MITVLKSIPVDVFTEKLRDKEHRKNIEASGWKAHELDALKRNLKMKPQPLSEILDAKSAGKSEFQLAVCKDDWMNLEKMHGWMKEIEAWCILNSFSSKHLKATSPIVVDGKEHANPRLNVSIVEFTKVNSQN